MENKSQAPQWYFPLSQALIKQAREIGVDIPEQDMSSVTDVASLQNVSSLEDMQLSVQVSDVKRIQDIIVPSVVVLPNDTTNEVKYVVVLAIDKTDVTVATNAEPIKIQLTNFKPSKLLVLRKNLERIYSEQEIESEKGHWFWSIFNKEYPTFSKVFIAAFFANLLAIVSSFFSLQVYDRVIPTKSEETLWALLIGVLIAFALEATLRIARSTMLDYSGKRIDVQSSALLLRRLLGLRLKADSPSPNRLSQMMREFNSVREFFTEAAVGSLIDIPFAILFLFVIYLIGGQVVWVAIIAIILMIIPPLMFRGKMMKIVASTLGSRGAANRLFNEASYQLDTVKTTQAHRFFEKQWDDISEVISDVSMRQRSLVTALTQWATTLQQVAYVMTITVAVYAAFEGKLTMGAIIALNILVSRTLAPITRLSSLLIRWAQVKSSLEELDLIAKGEQDDPIGSRKLRRPQLNGLLQLNNVRYGYDKETRPALQINQLTITPGEKIGILGPNGSGKSTLLKLLSGLQFAQQGEIKCDGIDVRQLASRDIRQQMTYVTQETQLFSGTLRQNLTLGELDVSDEEIMQALKMTGLANFLSSHPYGLDLVIKDGGVGLSVGQKQSVQLARMLLRKRSKILLLDEPTASLDPNVEGLVIQSLSQFARDKTMIAVTHRTPILAMVDRIIVISDGYIIADGPRDEVLKRIQQAQAQPQQGQPQQAQGQPQQVQPQQVQARPQQGQPQQVQVKPQPAQPQQTELQQSVKNSPEVKGAVNERPNERVA